MSAWGQKLTSQRPSSWSAKCHQQTSLSELAGSSQELARPRITFVLHGLGQRDHNAKENQEDSDARNPQTRSGEFEPFALQVILVTRHLGTHLVWNIRARLVSNNAAPPNTSRKREVCASVPRFAILANRRDTWATVPAQVNGIDGGNPSFPPILFDAPAEVGTLIPE